MIRNFFIFICLFLILLSSIVFILIVRTDQYCGNSQKYLNISVQILVRQTPRERANFLKSNNTVFGLLEAYSNNDSENSTTYTYFPSDYARKKYNVGSMPSMDFSGFYVTLDQNGYLLDFGYSKP